MRVVSLPRRIGPVLAALALLLALLPPAPAVAQSWPDGSTRIVVPYRPGTGPDTLARDLAERLAKLHGHPVIVENRDGGNGVIGTDAVAKAAGDGRTLLLTDSIALPVNAVMIRKVPYDWRKDLVAVSPVADVDLFVYTTPKRDLRSLQDLIRFARANPGVLNFGVVGNGSVSHLSVERLMAHEGLRMQKVNYNGIAQVVPALATGEIDVFVLGPAAFGAHVAEGRARVLATGADRRSAAFPDAPTLVESGLPAGLLLGTRFSLFAPGATPEATVRRINAAVGELLRSPEMREKFARLGLGVVSGDAAAEARRLAEIAGPVESLVRSLNIVE
jgi:tripartite-type tricarboxylate transporter receptor subunit TctC